MVRMIEWIVSSSALLAVLIVLRQLWKGAISLRLQYALWGLALLRLLIPFSFGSTAFSVQNALPQQQMKELPYTAENAYFAYRSQETITTETETRTYDLPRQRTEFNADREALEQSREKWTLSTHAGVVTLKSLALMIWIAGMAAVALCLLGSNLHFGRKLRRSRSLLTDGGELPVYLTDAADTPCLFGLIRPAIYVTPEATEDPARLRHVIEHELTHCRHGDQYWSLLRSLCLILHWYNPLVWWAAFLSRRDGELACDEATIARLGEGERLAYGRTLIDMTCAKRPALLVTATTMTGSKGGIRERIALIAKRPKTVAAALMVLLLTAAIAVGCTFTGAKKQETPVPTVTPTVAPSTAAPSPSPAAEEPTDEWFTETALPYASDYASAGGRSVREDGATVLRSADGRSADVVFPCAHGLRFSVSVSFIKGDDGTWSVLPSDAVTFVTDHWENALLRLDIGDQKVPNAVADYALDIAFLELEYLEKDCGYVFDDARITAITYIDTGTVGLWDGYNLYRVEWRFHPAEGEEIMLAGGMTMEDGWLTEWGSGGQPYILMGWRESNGEESWERICVTNTDVIETEYGTPEMLEKYGNAYTAAAVELRAKARTGQSLADPQGLTVFSPSSSPLGIGEDWAKAYAERLTQAPEVDPCYCRSMEVRSCELYAESLLSEPKQFIYIMRFACDPADKTAFTGQLVSGGYDTEHPDWLSFSWFVVLEADLNGGWECADAGTGGYGMWGWLDYGWNTDELLDRMVTEQVGGEDALMLLPLIDWSDFDRRYKFGEETWNALWKKIYEACIGEGRYYDLQRSQLWSDVFSYDQLYRDMYVILGFLHSDGAYAEGLAEILKKQYAYDPIGFEQSLNCFPYQQQGTIRSALGKVKTITLNIRDFAVSIGGTYTLRASLTPVGTDAAVYWISVDPAVAAVDENGTVTGVGCGTTRIIASASGISTECTVRVVEVSTGKVEETEPPLTVTLLIYDKPTREKNVPEVRMTLYLDGTDDAADQLKGIVDGIRFWQDDDLVDRTKFYFDGDMVFSDRVYIYYFSYEQRVIYYDHYFAQLSKSNAEYLKSLCG